MDEPKVVIDEIFPDNSLAATTPKDDVGEDISPKQIATLVPSKKPSAISRFFGGNLPSIGEYVLWDILIPAAKSTLSDIVSNTIQMMLYGEDRQQDRNMRRDRGRSYVSYSSLSRRESGRPRSSRSSRSSRRNRLRPEEIVIDDRREAEAVLSRLVGLVDEYDVVSVADFLELVGMPTQWSDNSLGWNTLRNVNVLRVRDGYILDLPRPRNID